jgi:hypothetical protein
MEAIVACGFRLDGSFSYLSALLWRLGCVIKQGRGMWSIHNQLPRPIVQPSERRLKTLRG